MPIQTNYEIYIGVFLQVRKRLTREDGSVGCDNEFTSEVRFASDVPHGVFDVRKRKHGFAAQELDLEGFFRVRYNPIQKRAYVLPSVRPGFDVLIAVFAKGVTFLRYVHNIRFHLKYLFQHKVLRFLNGFQFL
jgi:hypothetical protein